MSSGATSEGDIVKREEMNRIVQSELKHIPRGLRGSTQNILRLYYNSIRRHDLSINSKTTAKESLEKALEYLRKQYPDYLFRFETEFFHGA